MARLFSSVIIFASIFSGFISYLFKYLALVLTNPVFLLAKSAGGNIWGSDESMVFYKLGQFFRGSFLGNTETGPFTGITMGLFLLTPMLMDLNKII